MRLFSVIAAVVLIACAAAFAREQDFVQDPDIPAQIRNLGHADVAVRDAATAALVKVGPSVAAPIKEAMRQSDDPEFQARAKQVLLMCRRGGEIVDGLQLTLTTDLETIAPADDVTLTTTIKNTTAKDINLCVGVSFSGVAFEAGSALAATDVHGTALPAHWTVGFCGTGAHGLYVTIPANSSIAYRMPLKLQGWPERMQRENRTSFILAPGQGHRMIAVPDDAGTIRVRMNYSVGAQGHRGFGELLGPAQPANPAARYWNGEIQSNEVQLSVSRMKCG
jgi:hypothetical protein